MGEWSAERVWALAPDAASVSAAKGLVSGAKWVSAGSNETAVWGEAKGSGATPYQTAIDLREPAFKCSCPSRKFPCKHGLALFLRYANGEIGTGTPPTWVSDWLDKREEKVAKQVAKSEAPKAPVDEEAAEKRAQKRWRNILDGLDECESFLHDVAAQGLLASQEARPWDRMAARMVDAQAPGIAPRLRRVGNRIGVGADWAETVSGELGRLALLIEATRRIEQLPASLQEDVRTSLGLSVRKEDLTSPVESGTWDVLGQSTEVEERLSVHRSWLRHRTDRRWALHLSFSVAGQTADYRPSPGTGLRAEMQFFPSSAPLRVHLGQREISPFAACPGDTIDAALAEAAEWWAHNPWVDPVPVHLAHVQLSIADDRWFVVDLNGDGLPLSGPAPWPLLARSGNSAVDVCGEWNGTSLKLVSAWGEWGYLPL